MADSSLPKINGKKSSLKFHLSKSRLSVTNKTLNSMLSPNGFTVDSKNIDNRFHAKMQYFYKPYNK